MCKLFFDLSGVTIGHATDAGFGTGVTAILCSRPMVASVAALGGASGGHDLAALDPAATVSSVDAIVLAGGSAHGLAACGGAQDWLRAAGRGTPFAGRRVPLVAGAILYDLGHNDPARWGRCSPYRDLGWAAADAARPATPASGSVGAATGATTATLKGGFGFASARTAAGHTVVAVAVVNAIGTTTIGDGRHFWAAPFERDGEFGGLGWPAAMPPDALRPRLKGHAPATTLGVVMTDATLTKPMAHRLALMAHDGLARAVLPAHAPLDGDTIFALTTGQRPLTDPVAELTELGFAAAQALARAVARGVYEATPLPGFPELPPTWRQRFG